MSRQYCPSPYDCVCPPVIDENEQVLPCGPCSKCKCRSEAMMSNYIDAKGDLCGNFGDAEGNPPWHYWLYWKTIFLEDGVMYRKFEHRDGSGLHIQLITPESLHKEVLQLSHGNRLSGHLGRRRTREWLIQNFYWFEVRSDCDLYVTVCDICQSIKRPTKTPKARLGEIIDRHSGPTASL